MTNILLDPNDSYAHSLKTLEILNQFDDFKRSIKTMADLGCGSGRDLQYWANMQDYDEDGLPTRDLDIKCIGFDLDCERIKPRRDNIKYKNFDLNSTDLMWSVPFDVVWCHNLMQHLYSPVEFLGRVNRSMSMSGMFYLCVPSTVSVLYHTFQNYTPSMHYNTFTVTQIIYLLALNGFDVKDCYISKHKYDDFIEVIAYKQSDPLPYTTTWYEMVDRELLSDNMKEIVLKNGILSDQGIVARWIDGIVQDFRWHT